MIEMEDLPEELLVKIFKYLSPYKDHDRVACVSRKWNRIAAELGSKLTAELEQSLADGDVEWCEVEHDAGDRATAIPARQEQAICYNHEQRAVFMFGGRSVTNDVTGYNDLSALDMDTLTWSRPQVRGDIPLPKCNCILESYKHMLILYGGNTLPPNNTLRRGMASVSNDLHLYDTRARSWWAGRYIEADCPPAMSGKSSCVMSRHDDFEMDEFVLLGTPVGGRERAMWTLDLQAWTWARQTVVGSKQLHSNEFTGYACEVRASAYSSTLILLDPLPLSSRAYLLYKTSYDEWTCRHVALPTVPCGYSAFFFSPLAACSEVGRIFAFFALKPPNTPTCTLPDHVAKPKLVRSGTTPSCPPPAAHVTRTGPSANHRSTVGLFLLDLKSVADDEGELSWVEQFCDDTIVSSFMCDVPSKPTHAVLGRGELILVGAADAAHAFPSIYLVRGRR